MNKKIDYCSRESCKVQPIDKSRQSGPMRYSEHIRSGHYSRKISQGQPSDIQIYDILASEAAVKFSRIGNPTRYDVYIKIGRSIIQTYSVTSNTFNIEELTPNTSYEVEIVAHYISGDTFISQTTGKFKTLDEGPVTTIKYIYPDNQLFEFNRNTAYEGDTNNEFPIQILFEPSPGSPENYYIQLVETNTDFTLSTDFLILEPYTIFIRNDISNTLQITSEYIERFEYNDMSYAFIDIIPAFQEGYSAFTLTINANSVEIFYTEARGDPTYTFRIVDLETNTTEKVESVETYSSTYTINGLIMNTNYMFYMETVYINTSKNRYMSSLPVTTLNEGPVVDVRLTSFRNSLSFAFQPPSKNFRFIPNTFYFVILRKVSSNEILQYQYYPNNTSTIVFENLDENTDYNFYIATVYDRGNENGFIFMNESPEITVTNTSDGLIQPLNKELYEFNQTYKTLYEGPVESIDILTITGTSVYLSLTPFTMGDIPSIPDYYIIYYETNGISNAYETYLQEPILYDILIPNTEYNITVSAVYSTGNMYTYESAPTNRITLNEGPVKTLDATTIKGNKITLTWSFYDGIDDPITDLLLNIYQAEVLEESRSIPYTQDSEDIFDLSANTTYRFTLEVDYGNLKYERSIITTTLNEYGLIIERIAVSGSSILVYKTPENNQDDYVLERLDNQNNDDLLTWVNQRFQMDGGSENITIESNAYLYVEMDRAGYYVFYCPTQTQIDMYRIDVLTDETYKYVKTFRPRESMKIYHMSLSDNDFANPFRFALGYDNGIVDVYENYFGDNPSLKTISLPSNVRSHTVSLSRDGKICAVSDERANENADNGVFIYNLESDQETFVKYENNEIYYWYRHMFNKYVAFNYSGTQMAIAFELQTSNLDDSTSYESKVCIYDISSNSSTSFEYTKRSYDLSGNNGSLNGNGNFLLVANDRHIENGIMLGSVSLFDVSNPSAPPQLTHTFLGSSGSLINLPIDRRIFINDDATVVSISEYTYSYNTYNGSPVRNGQVIVYEYKNQIWKQRGDTFRQGDLAPTNPNDPIRTGEWYGYYTIMDREGDRILVGTRPKLPSSSNINRVGRIFLYVWLNPESIIQIDSWPAEIPNLQSDTDYRFRVVSYYNTDPDYTYFTYFSGSIPAGRTPITNIVIYNDKIDISWIPVDDVSNNDIFYVLEYTTINVLTTIHILYSNANGDNNSFYSIQGFNPNQEIDLTFSSIYISTEDSNFRNEYVGFLSTVNTLNEAQLDTVNIIELNNQNIIVLNIIQTENQGDISFNEIILQNTLILNENYSFILEPTVEYLDLDFVQAGQIYNFTINTTYITPTPQENISYISNNPYTASLILTISNDIVDPYSYIRNGNFYADYDTLFSNSGRTRGEKSITSGVLTVTPRDISGWENSRFVYIVENVSGTESTQKILNLPDISYHALLFRSEDLAPGTNIPPSFLEQSFDKIAYSQRYILSYYAANHDEFGVQYNELDDVDSSVFSRSIAYKIKLLEEDTVIYETSTIYSNDSSWNQSSITLFLDRTYDNVILRLERTDIEYNNLFISNIHLIGQSLLQEDLSYQWDTSWNASQWNTLTDISHGEWSDLWYTNSDNYTRLRYIFNISVSFWFFLHFNDDGSSETCFFIGEDEKLKFEFDNTYIYITNKLEGGTSERVDISFNFNTVHHLAYTYNTKKVKLYLDGRLHHSYTVSEHIMNADENDAIYLGKNNTRNMITKFTRIYDYELARYEVENIYTEEMQIYQYDSLGNPLVYSDNIIGNYTNSIKKQVFVYLHHYLGNEESRLQKNVNFYSTFSENVDLSGSMSYSISFWLGNSNGAIDISGNNQTIQITNSNIITKHENNHVVVTTNTSSMELYINGFFYQTLPYHLGSSDLDISGTNIGDIYVYDISFGERSILTSYYNYYQLSNEYIINSGIYRVTLTAPSGGNQQNVAYILTPLEIDSEYFFDSTVNGSFNISNSTDYYYDIPLTDFSLNWVNSLQKEFARFTIPTYGLELTFTSINNPYIDFSFGDVVLYETLDIEISLENSDIDTSYSYAIEGNVDADDFTDLYGNDISLNGYITDEITLSIPDDQIIDNVNHYETFIFRIRDLNIAKEIRVYERLFMTVNQQQVANFGEVSAKFSVQLFSLVDASFSYQITGVTLADISATTLSDTFTLTKQEIYYESNILNFEVSVDPFNLPDKFNLPFNISLLNTGLSYIQQSITINDYFNIQSNTTSVQEGQSFTITFKTPTTVEDGTAFTYAITGISSEDLISNSLTGTFVVSAKNATQDFTVAKDIAKDDSETFVITVNIPGDGQSDVMTSVLFRNLEPIFDIRATKNYGDPDVIDNIDEGESFFVELTTEDIPDNTLVPFIILGEVNALDISANNLTVVGNHIQGFFTVIDSSANVRITVNNDFITEGGEMIQLFIDNYVQYTIFVYVNDTSVYTIYNLTSDVTDVDEGSSFTVFLETVNVAQGTLVDYRILGIQSADILSLNTLEGQFTIDAGGNASQLFSIRADSLTEGDQTARFELVGKVPGEGATEFDLKNIFVNVNIIDTSRGPSITINMTANGSNNNEFNNGDTIRLSLVSQDVERGSRIAFVLDGVDDTDLCGNILSPTADTLNALQYYDGSYYGTFVVGYTENYILEVTNVSSDINIRLSLEGGNKFDFNEDTGVESAHVTLQSGENPVEGDL